MPFRNIVRRLLAGNRFLVAVVVFLSLSAVAATPASLQTALDDLRNRSYLLNEDQIRPELERIAEQFTTDTPQAIRDDWTAQYCRVFKPSAEQSALEYANARLVEFQQRGNRAGVVDLMRCQAALLGIAGELNQAETAFNAAYSQSQELSDVRLQADSLLARGEFYAYTGNLALALTDLLLSQRLFEALELEHASIGNLTNLAHVYRRLGDHEKSREYYQSVIDQVRTFDNKVMEAEAHMFIGWGFIEGLHYQEAEQSFAAARRLHQEMDVGPDMREYFRMVDDLHLGVIDTLLGRHQKALAPLADVAANANPRYVQIRALALYFRAHAIHGLGQYQQALTALQQAEELMSKLGNQRYLVRIYRLRSDVYAALEQFKSSHADLLRFIEEKEKLDQKMRAHQTARLRIEFDTERTLADNRRLQMEQRLQEQQVQALEETRRWQMAFMVLGGSMILMLLVQQLRRARRLHILAMTDELTRLPNRRAIIEFGKGAWKNTARASRPFSVIVLDIDHFKQINDSWGHDQGDKVLQGVAQAVQSGLRERDRVARIGGEEFLILLPGADTHHAERAAERVRTAVQSAVFTVTPEHQTPVNIPVTISLGVSSRRAEDSDLSQVISRADVALYQAKNNGRNRVEVDVDGERN